MTTRSTITTITAMAATKVMVSFFGSSAGASGVGSVPGVSGPSGSGGGDIRHRVAVHRVPDDIPVDGVDRAVVLQAYGDGGSIGDVDGHVLRDVA